MELTPALMARCCATDRAGIRLLEAAVRRMTLSAPGYDRVRKVARTIADLTAAESINSGSHRRSATVLDALTHTLHELGFRVDAGGP